MNFRGKKLFDASFDKFAKVYDDVRPRYPDSIYNDINNFCKLSNKTNVLEIGTGSGNATEGFVKTGASITTVEPGENLINVAKENLSQYSNIQFICDTFENCEFDQKSFDVIISATTFHWLEKANKYSDCCRYLKDDGYLVLFWNSFCRENSDIMRAIDDVYIRNIPEVYEKKEDINTSVLDKVIKRECELIENDHFYITSLKRYKTEYKYNADSYVALLNTYPKIINLCVEKREKFFEEIKQTISDKVLTIPILTSLYVFRKKDQFTNDLGSSSHDIFSSEEIDILL